MNKISHYFKTLLFVFALGAVITGCDRRDADQSGTQSSGATSTPGSDSMSSGERSSGATGSAGANASGSAERAIDDSVITTKAKSALLADTTVKGTDINVETNRGVVSLSGMVDNDRQRDRAASIVRGIDGVKSVENKMTVKQ